MLNVGIVTEGVRGGTDQVVLSELIRRVALSPVTVIARPCGGAIDVVRKFPEYLEEFRNRRDIVIHKAVVIRDADNKPPQKLRAAMQAKIAARARYPFPVGFQIIREELEAWLLADEGALSRKIGRPVRAINTPEGIFDPKLELQRVLSTGGVDYTSVVAGELAASLDIGTLESRCPSFREFKAIIVSPI